MWECQGRRWSQIAFARVITAYRVDTPPPHWYYISLWEKTPIITAPYSYQQHTFSYNTHAGRRDYFHGPINLILVKFFCRPAIHNDICSATALIICTLYLGDSMTMGSEQTEKNEATAKTHSAHARSPIDYLALLFVAGCRRLFLFTFNFWGWVICRLHFHRAWCAFGMTFGLVRR